MKLLALIIIFIFGQHILIFSQSSNESKINELLQKVSNTKDTTAAIKFATDAYFKSKNSKLTTKSAETAAILSKLYAGLNIDSMRHYSQLSADYYSKINDKLNAGSILKHSGSILLNREDYSASADALSKANKLLEESGELKELAESQMLLAAVQTGLGKHNEAIEAYTKSGELFKRLGILPKEFECLIEIGDIYYSKGQYKKALETYKSGQKLLARLNNKEYEVSYYSKIANAQLYLGEFQNSIGNHFKALKIADESGDKFSVAASNTNIGIIYKELGYTDEAIRFLLDAQKMYNELGEIQNAAYTSLNLASLYIDMKKLDEALRLLIQAKETFKKLDDNNAYLTALLNVGDIYINQPDIAKASEYIEEALIQADSTDNFSLQGQAYLYGGRLRIYQSNYKQAIELLNRADKRATEMGNALLERDSKNYLSIAYSKLGDYQKAFSYQSRHIALKDSLFDKERMKELARLEAKNEYDKARAIEKQKIAETERRKKDELETRNSLQYTAIVIILVIIIVFIMIISSSKVMSNLTEPLVFVTFLLSYEFILVFLDPWIDALTEGVPVFKLLINIMIAITLIPLHKAEQRLRNRFKGKGYEVRNS